MIRDLLTPPADAAAAGGLELREDAAGVMVVAGLSEIETTSTEEMLQLLHHGNQRRSCEPTSKNRTSSRSHAVVKVIATSKCNLRWMYTY